MGRISIVGDENFRSRRRVQSYMRSLYDEYGNTAFIRTGGSDNMCENLVKKLAIEYGMGFKEYNPAYTGYRMYSAMNESYYKGKRFHITQLHSRYDKMLRDTDLLVIFLDESTKDIQKSMKHLLKKAKKMNIPISIIN